VAHEHLPQARVCAADTASVGQRSIEFTDVGARGRAADDRRRRGQRGSLAYRSYLEATCFRMRFYRLWSWGDYAGWNGIRDSISPDS